MNHFYLTGYIYDVYGDYKIAFVLAGIPPFLGALLMIPILKKQRAQKKLTSRSNTSMTSSNCNKVDNGNKSQLISHNHQTNNNILNHQDSNLKPGAIILVSDVEKQDSVKDWV